MPPKRQPAKRKSATRDSDSSLDQDVDGSGDTAVIANKKAKRSEGRSTKAGRDWKPDRSGEDDEDEFRDAGLDKLNHAALQRKASQKEIKKSKEFITSFRRKQEAEEKELAEFAQRKVDDIESIFKTGFQRIDSEYFDFLKRNDPEPREAARLDAQPLYGDGQRIQFLCREVLRHYKGMNNPGKCAELKLDILSDGQDKRDVLDIIMKARGFGEKMINASMSPSAGDGPLGDGPLAAPTPASSIDEIALGFFEKSMARLGENTWGKGSWGMWMAWDKVAKGLQEDAK